MDYHTIYLGLGSNLGDRKSNILQAIDKMKNIGIEILQCSSIIETDPVGGPKQEKFLNAVVKAKTELSPQILLGRLKEIEKKLGRIKTELNGPRTIDIDILLYDNLHVSSDELTIPHPRMFERDFVMEPLREIDSEKFQDITHANHQ